MTTTTPSSAREKPGTDDAWLELKPGDQVRVKSHSGNDYEATIVYAGIDDAGLYVRLGDGRLARLLPNRVNWKTLKRVGRTSTVAAGDEVLIFALGSAGVRGKISSKLDERLLVAPEGGDQLQLTLKEAETKRFRLLFHTTKLRAGDEFMVKSRSGRQLMGRVIGVSETKISALLRPNRERVSIKIDHLALESLYVLIPVLGAAPTWERA